MNRIATAPRTTSSHSSRRAVTALVAVAIGAGSALGVTSTAAAAPSQPASASATSTVQAAAAKTPAQLEAQFLALLNAHRKANKVPALKVSADLTKVATRWATTMAGGKKLAHNPKLATQVKNWQVVGENVGDGSDVTTLDKAFWASSEHRANELYKPFTQVGVGVVVSKGTIWVTFDFRQPMK